MRKLFRLLGREPDVARDVEDELRSHLAMKVDDLVRAGMSEVEAQREAERLFGAPERIERATRAQALGTRRRRWWWDRWSGWWADGRIGVRTLRRTPLYTGAAILILAIGIGATVAVLAIADRVLIRPLPLEAPDRVMVLVETREDGSLRLPSYPIVKDWRDQAAGFASFGYVTGSQVFWRTPSGVENLAAAFPEAEFFRLMAAPPLLGRVLSADDEREGARVAVLSHALWVSRFGADPAALGATLTLRDGPVTIVGVMPAGFLFPAWADLYLPISTLPNEVKATLALRGNHADAIVVGRLALGATRESAEASMKVVATRLADAYPDEQSGWTTISAIPIRDYLFQYGNAGLTNPTVAILVFVAGVGLVLLIACANVAGLTLVRGQARGRELAIRTAIGASRWHLIRQLLVESGILAIGGGMIGLGFAHSMLGWLQRSAPELFPRLAEVRIYPPTAVLTVGLALASAILSGLFPALKATPTSLGSLVKGGGFQGTATAATGRLQRGLVVGQLALAVTLLIGATVLVKSFIRVLDADLGFEPHGLIGATINSPTHRTEEQMIEFYRQLTERVADVPGVAEVALTNHLPISGASYPTKLVVEGYQPLGSDAQPYANFRLVSPEYFDTMAIPVRKGRVFTAVDLAAPNGGVVVNQSLADRYWPNQDPIGKRITVFKSARWWPDFGEPIAGVVIGVTGDVHHFGPEAGSPDEVYLPYTQNPWAWAGLVVRASGNPETLIDPIWRAITGIDPDIPARSGAVRSIFAFEQSLAESRGPRRLMTVAATGTALTAVLLALAGLYGVMAYLVGLRRREIAIRGALGATPRQVVGLVLRQGLAVAALGIAVGALAGWLAASLLQGLVFGVSVRDLSAFTVVPILLLLMAAAATYLPARRASRFDPAHVLKED